MLRTTEDVDRNYEERRSLVQSIALNQSMVEKYLVNDPTNLLQVCSNRLAELHFELYIANKEYDEYLAQHVAYDDAPKKSIWKKLLRK